MKPAPFASEENEGEDPLLGAVLAGTYRIDRLVAEGGMGRLYAGVHERLGMDVAIKVLLELRGNRPEAVQRAEREARAMAEIVSPHVARVIDLVKTPDGRPCLVTELLHGGDLSERLERGKMNAKEAARIAHSVCMALTAAHQKGILHRDIKPSNVFLTNDDEVKLLDFGVAKLEGTHTLTHAGAFIGTPAYMSPEQAASPSDVDERSEVYAVAAVLYHMLSGSPPYGDLDATQTLTRLLSGEPPRLNTFFAVPPGLGALVERAMSREKSARHASVTELAAALEPYTGDEKTASAGANTEARWLRPRAIIAVVGTAIMVGLWASAIAFEIGLVAHAFESWPPWALTILRAVPAIVVLIAAILATRSLIVRWRSTPRVEGLVIALRRAVWLAVAGLGVLAAARPAAGLFGWGTGLPDPIESIVSLGLVFVVGAILAALLGQLRKLD